MTNDPVPNEVKRFILTSVASVPHLEALLLLRAEAGHAWDGERVAKRLYVSERQAAALLEDLCAAGVLAVVEAGVRMYRYQPISEELRQVIDQTAAIYAKKVVHIATLIHSRSDKKAQRFADAFKLRKDS
jgi:hypothetical protein